MIKLKEILLNERKVPKISKQSAIDRGYIGPVFHGTSETKRQLIDKHGFKVFKGDSRSGDVSNGYELGSYYNGIPAPIHHLGRGIYFTQIKKIATGYNHGTTKGLAEYYLDIPQKLEFNKGANKTMMEWWLANGYNYRISPQTTFGNSNTNLELIKKERERATNNLTKTLASQYDAVIFTGAGMYTRSKLDGNQVCVYDASCIYEIEKKLTAPGDIGSRVRAKISIDRYNKGTPDILIGTKGVILKKEDAHEITKQFPLAKEWVKDANIIYTIKWAKGGMMRGVLDTWIELL